MPTLAIVAIITYLFAESLERANRQGRIQAKNLAEANDTLAQTTEDQQALLQEQEHMLKDHERLFAEIHDLSATVLQVANHVLLCPLVGTLTKKRLDEITRSVLATISERRATQLIIDVTGQNEATADVVAQLAKLVQAARLLGCAVYLPESAPASPRS